MQRDPSLEGRAIKALLLLLLGGVFLLTGCDFPGDTYTVTVSAADNGTITASPTKAAEGDTITLTITPDAGYEPDVIKWDDTVLTPTASGTTYTATFTMPAKAVTVTGTFKPAATYAVTVTAPTKGTITASAATAEAWATITLTITPDAGYDPDVIKWNDGSDHALTPTASGTAYTASFTMPDKDVTVSGTFKVKSDTIAVNFAGFGDETINLSQDDGQTLSKSEWVELEITLSGSYTSVEWYLDGRHHDRDPLTMQFTVDTGWGELTVGPHTITVVVVGSNGIPYSKVVKFEVEL
jgi:hypothetical protein